MDSSTIGLVLFSALLHAGWNAVVKIRGERLVAMAMISAGAGLTALACLPFAPAPAPASWPWLAFSIVLQTGYKLFLLGAYRHGDLGQVYPIARGTAPLLVTLVTLVFLDEPLAPAELGAVLVITSGVAALALRGGGSLRRDPRPVLYALGTAVFIASYTLIDGTGARIAGSPHGYALWLFVFDAVPIALIALWRHGAGGLAQARRNLAAGLIGGVMALGSYWLVIWALTLGPMAPVAALRETGVVFAMFLGAAFLKERLGAWRLASVAAVAAGVVLLRLA
jgi:drug/metabolite transporter (DMT)-like permease